MLGNRNQLSCLVNYISDHVIYMLHISHKLINPLMKTNSLAGPEVASGVALRLIDSQTQTLCSMKIHEKLR